MGSSVPKDPLLTTAAQASVAPEMLARLVLRCRELSTFLEQAVPRLPAREETPFLYGQLDDVLQRLNANLRQVTAADSAPSEKGASFLRRLAGKKTREQPRKSEPRYDMEGNAWTIPVTELVGFLSHSGKTGLLWVTSSSETFVLEFSRGNLVHATSNAPPVAFRLGEILLNENLLTAAELAEVIDFAKAADDLLGSYLVRTGRLQHSDLQRALAIQVQQLFHRLMDAENALYRFQEGAQLLRSQSLEVNITHLLLESARKKDEERQEAEGPRSGVHPSGLDLLAPEEPRSAAQPAGAEAKAPESRGNESRASETKAAESKAPSEPERTEPRASASPSAEHEAAAEPEAALPHTEPTTVSEKATAAGTPPSAD
jgi:hypothetical protein